MLALPVGRALLPQPRRSCGGGTNCFCCDSDLIYVGDGGGGASGVADLEAARSDGVGEEARRQDAKGHTVRLILERYVGDPGHKKKSIQGYEVGGLLCCSCKVV